MYQSIIEKIDWQKCDGLIPAIVQDSKTLEVLMLGYMNKEALTLTQDTQKVHFWSRTKNRIWMKGEESGNILNVSEIHLDCDNDTILTLVNPVGNTCHTGVKSCFNVRTNFLAKLERTISDRIKNPKNGSYTSELAQRGINKVAQKVGEEATEVVIATLTESDELLLGESADLLFHLLVALQMRNLELSDVIAFLRERGGKNEKNIENPLDN